MKGCTELQGDCRVLSPTELPATAPVALQRECSRSPECPRLPQLVTAQSCPGDGRDDFISVSQVSLQPDDAVSRDELMSCSQSAGLLEEDCS